MAFRIHRGLWQFQKADGNYETKYKINDSGVIVQTDASGNEVTGLTVAWSSVTGKPSTFAPSAHSHAWSEITSIPNALSSITDSAWAGTSGYRGYTYSGGNSRFGFSSTSGVVDVYADGNFYAQEGAKKLATEEYVTTRGYLTSYSETDTLATVTARGAVTSSRIYADNGLHVRGDWVRVNGSTGIYFESYGGGWNMTDSTWIRAYNNKGIYTSGDMQASRFYDANDSNYYIDSAGTSHMNDLRVNIIYDRNNTNYYVDPASTTVLNTTYINTGYIGNVRGDYYFQQSHGTPRNNLGDPTVTEMALFNEQFNNKTAFCEPSRVTIWKQQNDGDAWEDITSLYGDAAIRRFMAGYDSSSNIYIQPGTFKFRIEVSAVSYVSLQALYMYWSSNSHNTKLHVWARRVSDGVWLQVTNSDTNISSWPGHIYLPFPGIWFLPGPHTSTAHRDIVRFEFTPNWSTGTYADRNIDLYKMQVWGGYPAGTRFPYTVNEYGDFNLRRNLSAPGIVYANGGNSDNWNTAYSWGNHGTQGYATEGYVTTQINNLISGAPGALNTLDELAAALGDDANFATTITNALAGKASTSHNHDSSYYNVNQDITIVKNTPRLVLDSASGGSESVEQAAIISLGESGTGSASLHLSYIGSGYSYIGMGNLGSDNVADYYAIRLYYGNNNVFFPATNNHITDINAGANAGNAAYGWGNHASAGYLTSVPAQTWASITGKPTTFTPSSHTHAISDVTGLQSSLDGKQAAGSYLTASHLNDYTNGSYRVIADYGGNTTWYLRSNGQFIFGTGHDWTAAFRLNIGQGSGYANNGAWAYFGQQDSNNAMGTWRGVRIRKYYNGAVDGDLSAGAYYVGDTQVISGTRFIGTADAANSVSWGNVSGKPSTFAPSGHTHAISDVTGLQTALDGKQVAGSYAESNHNHTYNVNDSWLRENGDNANFKIYGNTRQMVFRTDGATEYASGVGGYAFAWMYGGDNASHRRMLLASDGRIWSSYHGWLDDAFQSKGSYAATSHTHAISDVTGLQTALDGKQASGSYLTSLPAHNHDGVYLPIGGKAADANLLDGLDSSRFLYTTTGQFSGDWNALTDSNQEIRLVEVHNITGGAHTNYPTGVYHYGSVFGWQLDSATFKMYASHTGDLAFQTGWNNDAYSGWRTIIHSANIGNQSVNYATSAGSAGNADTVDGYHASSFFKDNEDRRLKVLRFTGEGGDSGNSSTLPYAIYQEGGAWTHPYPNLRINMHTGISFGANASYGGYRFMSDYNTSNIIFSVNDGDANVRVTNNLYIGSAGGWITDLLAGKQAAGSYATAAQGTNADTAHGWGNHANAGYLTALPAHNHDGSYLPIAGKAADSNLLDGLDLHTGRNNEANKVVRTDGSGYIQAGWINTTSGDNGTTAIARIYASHDGYIRYYTPANFRALVTDGIYQPAGSYAAASHTHSIANITNLQSTLNAKLNGDSVAMSSFYNTFQTYTSKYDDGSLRQTAAAGDANAGVSFMYFPTAANADSPATDSGPLILSMSPGAPSATYDAATRIQQLAFGQTQGLSYRISTSATAWTGWTRVMDTNNFSTWAVSKTYNTSLNSDSRNSRGVTRLYRRDSDSDFSVQTYWTGSKWRLYGYNGDSNHADTHVGYADSAGSASSASSATTATNVDNGNTYTTGSNLYIKNSGVNNYRVHHNGTDGVFDVTNRFSIRDMSTIWSAAQFESGSWMSYAWFDIDPWGNNWGVGSRPTSWKTVNRGTFLTFGFEDWSDRRSKSAIVEIDNAIDKVKAIGGYTYWKIGSTAREAGVVAQDVLEVFPEAIGGTEEGYSVKPAALIGLLSKAIKEQQELIDSLVARIELLENK